MSNGDIKEAIDEARKKAKEQREQRLDKLVDKSIDNIEKALSIDEDDPSLNFFKMMAIQHKTKTSENHLKRMGFDSPEKREISGNLNLTWKEIIYGTVEDDEAENIE